MRQYYASDRKKREDARRQKREAKRVKRVARNAAKANPSENIGTPEASAERTEGQR
jgi:hypothetical protein